MCRIGNRLAVSHEALRQVCSGTHEAARLALASPRMHSISEIHNRFLTHTLLGLFLTTAARPVRDPFHALELFSTHTSQALLVDKVSDRSKETRLVVMAHNAVIQLQHWIQHLQALAAILSHDHPNLAAQIQVITQPDGPRPIPLFFLLKDDLTGIERISRKDYEQMLRPYWTLPGNFQRSSLSTWLREDACPAELVDMQLGHASAGNTPYGLASPYSPFEVRDLLQPRLDRYLAEMNWQTLKGLRMPTLHRLAKIQHLCRQQTTDAMIGPGQRAAAREFRWSMDSQFVTSLLRARFPLAFDDSHPAGDPLRFPKEISNDEIRHLTDAIFMPSDKNEERTLVRLQLLRRYLARLRRHGVKVILPGRMATLNPEPSPFNNETLVLAVRAEEIRDRLIELFETRSKAGVKPSTERRIAEILVAAPLFSAQLWETGLRALPQALLETTYHWDNTLFVDLTIEGNSSRNTVRRWFPDALSSALILGLRKQIASATPAPGTVTLTDEIKAILDALTVPIPRQRRQAAQADGDPIALCSPLLKLARAYWSLRLPAQLRAYAEGSLPSASLPLSAWIRLSADRPLRQETHPTASSEPRPVSDMPDTGTTVAREARGGPTDAMSFWKELNKLLSPKTNETNKRSHRWRRARLAVEIRRLARNYPGKLPWVSLAVADWAIALCQRGTRFKEQLAISTVIKYIRAVGRPLIDFARDTDFLNLSAIGYTALYSHVVASKNGDMQSFTASRLGEFHSHIIAKYAVPDADWNDIHPDDSLVQRVDAGLLSETEYLRAYALLRNDPHVDARNRHAAAIYLMLAYRFGLRRGEICRLLRRDVQLWQDQATVIVNNTIYGQTKTLNGIRQVPLVEQMTADEWNDLRHWLTAIDASADRNSLVALFGERSNQKSRLDLTRIAYRVTEALVASTGDPEARIHHLRHAYATRLFLCTVGQDSAASPVASWLRRLSSSIDPIAVRQSLTDRSERSQRLSYALGVIMGHGSPRSSLTSYVHFLDVCLASAIGEHGCPALSDHVLAYCVQTNGSALRVLRHRLRKDSESTSHGDTLSTIVRHIASRLQWPDLTLLLAPIAHVPQLPAPQLSMSATFGPADLDRFLSIVRHHSDTESLAEVFHIDEETVGKIRRSAAEVERISGFSLFKVSPPTEFDYTLDEQETNLKTVTSRQVHDFLMEKSTQAALSEHPEIIENLTALWEDAHHPNSAALLFPSYEAAVRFTGCAAALGLNQFEILRPSELQTPPTSRSPAPWASLPTASRLPMRNEKTRPRQRGRLAVVLNQSTSTHPITTTKTLNRLLFILATWKRITFPETIQDVN